MSLQEGLYSYLSQQTALMNLIDGDDNLFPVFNPDECPHLPCVDYVQTDEEQTRTYSGYGGFTFTEFQFEIFSFNSEDIPAIEKALRGALNYKYNLDIAPNVYVWSSIRGTYAFNGDSIQNSSGQVIYRGSVNYRISWKDGEQ